MVIILLKDRVLCSIVLSFLTDRFEGQVSPSISLVFSIGEHAKFSVPVAAR